MTENVPPAWQIFIEQYPQFMKLMRSLGKTDWYPRDHWAMFIGQYHAGIYFQLYKPNWYNFTLNGIHIETGMTAENLETKRLRIDLHIGHANLFDREKFNALTIPHIEALVATWNGEVHLSKNNLSDRMHTEVKFTKSGFAKQLTDELTRWSALGTIIDEGLAKME